MVLIPFTDAVIINPTIKLKKGNEYPFVDMASVSRDSRTVYALEKREYTGGGSKFQDGDTLMARITPCLENGKISRYKAKLNDCLVGFGSTEFLVIRGKPSVTDNDFAYYLTQWDEFQNFAISQMTGSSGRQRVPVSALSHFFVNLPPLPVQKKIAAILSSLDDKIEINTRMNKVLEETARTLFHRWFVEFEFPNDEGKPYKSSGGRMIASEMGEIPEGWRVGTLKELITIIGGGTPKTSIKEYWTGTIPWFSVVDAPKEGDIFVLDTEKHVSELGIENSSTQILPLGTTIISARGTVGKIAMVGTPMAMNQSCYGIKGKDAGTDIYIYYLISNMVGTLQKQGHGSVFNTITRDTINNQQVVIPDIEIRSTFDQAQLPLFQQIKTNLQQSDALKKIRDTLLPKLLCGEL